MFKTNRVVALLTPVFSALAAAVAVWLRNHFPGVPVPTGGELLGAEIAGATAAAAAALSWLKGHQQWEAHLQQTVREGQRLEAEAAKIDPALTASVQAIVKAEAGKLEQCLLAKIKPAAPVSPLPSDAEEATSQPPAAPVDSPRPESAIAPDPLPAPDTPAPAAA